MTKRVVVTGMGMLSPVGNNVEDSWANIKAGNTGIDYISKWDASELGVKIGGEVLGYDPEAEFGRREARRTDPNTHFAWTAANQAIAHSGLTINDSNRDRIGTIIGSGLSGITTLLEGIHGFEKRGQRGVSPLMVPMMLPDAPSGKVSIEYGLRGPNMSLASACSTGNNAIGEAMSWIQRGVCDVMLAGATEASVMALSVASFDNMTALSRRNDDPKHASRPFDKDRDGFIMAEGSAVLVLEDLEFAKARGANILAEVVGYGMSSDAYHVTAPAEDGNGAARAMQMALDFADMTPQDIDYINAHGTSTPLNDAMETRAIKMVFGEQAYDVPISSTKSMTGHGMGAGAAIEAVFCIKALHDNFIPPTVNLEAPDEICDLDYVPHEGRSKELNVIMSNAFGFGGHNVVIIFKKYQDA